QTCALPISARIGYQPRSRRTPAPCLLPPHHADALRHRRRGDALPGAPRRAPAPLATRLPIRRSRQAGERGDLPLYLRGAAPPAPATSRPLGRARSTTGQTRHADHPLPVAKRWNKPPGPVSPALTVLAITCKVILTHDGGICPLCDERGRAPGRLTTWTSATATS